MAELYQFGEFVTHGEEETAHYLRDKLPKDWVVVTNKIFVMPNRSTREVDFLIIGEHRIFVADEKGFRGRIHGNETYWVLDSCESLPNPMNNMEMVARKVAGYLRDQVPRLETTLSGHFVEPVILLSSSKAELLVQEPRRERIIKLSDAEQVLRALDRRGRDEHSIAPLRDSILDKLRILPPRPSLPKSINAYKILESLPSGPHYRSFVAEHEAGGRRRLKLYELSGLGDAERAQQKELIYRDFHATSRATAAGLSPTVDTPFSWGDDRYVVVPQHLVDFPSLRFLSSEMGRSPLTLDEALNLGEALFDALRNLHSLGILHRNLTPDNTFVDLVLNKARVLLTDLDFARVAEVGSIASVADTLFQDSPYRAPELTVGLSFASPASDLFSAGIILAELLSGEAAEAMWDENGVVTVPLLRLVETSFGSDDVDSLRQMLQGLVLADDRARWQSADDACELLREFRISRHAQTETTVNQSGLVDKESLVVALPITVPRDGERGIFQIGDLIAEQFTVERILGAGATAVTYLVSDIFYGGDRSVLKVIKDPLTTRHLAGNEYRALKALQHRAIPRVLDVRPPSADFHLRLEFVDGASLSDLTEEFPWSLSRVLDFGDTILDALCLLEKNGLAHRDISARNILVGKEGPKLIDFGFASASTAAHTTLVGTPAFRSPEIDSGLGWNATCDTYALGVILLWMTTGKFPFEQDLEGRYDKTHIGIVDLYRHEEDDPNQAAVYDALISVLRRAVSPNRDGRFQSAMAFRDLLRSAGTARVAGIPVEGKRVENEWVRDIQGLYRNSRVGNADNRGLDTDFAEDTYVPTRLDYDLIPSVMEGKYQVVLLSGNPGDGKTAWLEKLGSALEDAGAEALSYDLDNGWKYTLKGHTFAANFDASESSKGKRANELLDEILKPLRGIEPSPDRPYTALIAINDGKLREFILNNPEYGWLGQQVSRLLEQNGRFVDPRIALVDLKQRSVVGGNVGEGTRSDLYEQVLLKMVDAEGWSACNGCRARRRCPIKFNRDTLVDDTGGSVVRGRLRALLQITHLRRERHITMRDLRSVLSYIIAGTVTCNDIHSEIEAETVSADWHNRLYFMAAFNPDGEAEDNLSDFAHCDPALVTTPPLDRFLHYRRRSKGRNVIEPFTMSIANRSPLPLEGLNFGALNKVWYNANKRRLFFEANPDPSSADELASVAWTDLLPYRHFSTFLDVMMGKMPMDEVRGVLCEAISRANGIVDENLYRRYLCIRTSRNEIVDLTVFKRFPQEEFDCHIVTPLIEKVEFLPNAIELRHKKIDARIVIGLDLFEILLRFTQGYEPGAEEQQPFVIDLAQFQNRLLNQRASELILLEAGRKLHGVRQQGSEIILLSVDEMSFKESRTVVSQSMRQDAEQGQVL